ncbi:glycosyltransferase [Massilia oculi]|uniref:Glycosyltransferase n=1 Tax=Massilia hydrophila TaxID=3044279 RepID=A0ABS7Y4M2_9BURK|nr:glycosyltransferase [Massilia oculi]MCA1854626.1 glycosyltransferase [Massilia oculi]
MKKVLHVISGLKVGGAEMVLLRLIMSSRGRPYSHSVISLTPGGGMRQRFADAAVDVIELDFKRNPLVAFFRLVKIIRERQPDIVQTWMYHADLLGGVAARLAGCTNVIWGIRTTDVQAGGSRATTLLRNLCAKLSSRVPRFIVCAAQASKISHAAVGYDARRMIVVPNGFDLSRLTASADQRSTLRADCGFADEDLVVGSLGRFNQAKDPKNFVLAAGLLAKQFANVRFLMVGRDIDESNDELRTWITETGNADRFVLLGERSDVPVCLAAMDVFCLSSRTEGFPNVIGEAMAMRLPCVTTDVGDAALLVAETGTVVPKESPDALADGLAKVVQMSGEGRRQLGEKACARLYAEFSMERARDRFESLYKKIDK